MAPCELEVYIPTQEKWVKVIENKLGDPPGSFSNVKPDGKREIYLVECAKDDSQTTISRSGLGVDAELGERGELRVVIPDSERMEVVKSIRKGESFEMEIATDRGTHSKIRITHRS